MIDGKASVISNAAASSMLRALVRLIVRDEVPRTSVDDGNFATGDDNKCIELFNPQRNGRN